jgi:hypothetical protein
MAPQGPVHGLLDHVAWVGGGGSDQRQQRREIFVRRVIGFGGGLHGQARHEPKSGAADELALGAGPFRRHRPGEGRVAEEVLAGLSHTSQESKSRAHWFIWRRVTRAG